MIARQVRDPGNCRHDHKDDTDGQTVPEVKTGELLAVSGFEDEITILGTGPVVKLFTVNGRVLAVRGPAAGSKRSGLPSYDGGRCTSDIP